MAGTGWRSLGSAGDATTPLDRSDKLVQDRSKQEMSNRTGVAVLKEDAQLMQVDSAGGERSTGRSLSTWAEEDDCQDLALLLERVARELQMVLVIVLAPLPGVELARLACVHRAYWLALLILRRERPGRRYGRPAPDSVERVFRLGRLARAGWLGDVAVLQRMISAGVDEHGQPLLKTREHDGRLTLVHALYFAVKLGHFQAAELLLGAGADVRGEADQALPIATDFGHTNLVALLLKHGADVHAYNSVSLKVASEKGFHEVVELLLKSGADVHANNDASLRVASYHGHLNVVELLIEHGANVHAKDGYALRFACDHGHTEVVRLLIQHGADVTADADYVLRLASASGRLNVAALLIQSGADVHAEDNQALRRASENGHADVVALLIEHGADVRADNSGALRLAAERGHASVVELLLKHGADAHADKDAAWRSASKGGHADVLALLIGSVGAIGEIVAAMRAHPNNASIQEQGCLALNNMIRNNEDNKVKAGSAGAIEAVVAGMRAHVSSAGVQLQGCRALYSLAYSYEDNKIKAGSAGAFEAVVAAMRVHASDAVVQEASGHALSIMIANSADNGVKARSTSAVDALGRRKRGVKSGELVHAGKLVLENGWHNAGCIFPDGFTFRKGFRSSVALDELCIHECSITSTGICAPMPTFRITAADRPDEPLEGKSATKCWTMVLARINGEIERRRKEGEDWPPPPKTAIAGPEYFGLKRPDVVAAIEALDPEHRCTDYWAGKEAREELSNDPERTTAPAAAVPGAAARPPKARRALREIERMEKELRVRIKSKDLREASARPEMDEKLRAACGAGIVQKLRKLIDKGANMESKDSGGYTPLHCAALFGKVNAVRYLVEKGANIEARDACGRTPLHLATQNGNVDAVRYLVEKGANIEAKNMAGKSVMELAKDVVTQSVLLKAASQHNATSPAGQQVTAVHSEIVTTSGVEEVPFKRHHHNPPETMSWEYASECLRAFRFWIQKAAQCSPGDGLKRCCARVHDKCKGADGKNAGGSKTATFRNGVEGRPLCNWCYPLFNRARSHARQALELHGDLAPQFADLLQFLDGVHLPPTSLKRTRDETPVEDFLKPPPALGSAEEWAMALSDPPNDEEQHLGGHGNIPAVTAAKELESLIKLEPATAELTELPPAKKRHHHDPPETMSREEASECLRSWNDWVTNAQKYPPEPSSTRCCARVHADCFKGEGKKAGGSKTAIFRTGVRDGWQLCNWCYPPFNKARKFAEQAARLYPDLTENVKDIGVLKELADFAATFEQTLSEMPTIPNDEEQYVGGHGNSLAAPAAMVGGPLTASLQAVSAKTLPAELSGLPSAQGQNICEMPTNNAYDE